MQTIALISVVAPYRIWLDSIQVYNRVCTVESYERSCKNLSSRDEQRETSEDALVRHEQRLPHNERLASLWCITSRYMIACRVSRVVCQSDNTCQCNFCVTLSNVIGPFADIYLLTSEWIDSSHIRMTSFGHDYTMNDIILTSGSLRDASWCMQYPMHHAISHASCRILERSRCQTDVFHCIIMSKWCHSDVRISLRCAMMHGIWHASCHCLSHSDMRKTTDRYPCPINDTVLTTT